MIWKTPIGSEVLRLNEDGQLTISGKAKALSAEFANSVYITDSGKMGIGTTTPVYALHVVGDVAGQSFVNISTRDAKENIEYYELSDYDIALDKIRGLKVATYDYKVSNDELGIELKDESSIDGEDTLSITSTNKYLGLIAEESPRDILSIDGKGVDLYKLSTLTVSGLKALDLKVAVLEALAGISIPADSTSDTDTNSSLMDIILGAFENLGVKIANGFASFKNLVANSLKIGSSEKPNGITLFDEVTGEAYCLKIRNGQPVSTLGECVVEEVDISSSSGNQTSDVEIESTESTPEPESLTSDVENPQTSDVSLEPTEEAVVEEVIEEVPAADAESSGEPMEEIVPIEVTPEPVVEQVEEPIVEESI